MCGEGGAYVGVYPLDVKVCSGVSDGLCDECCSACLKIDMLAIR